MVRISDLISGRVKMPIIPVLPARTTDPAAQIVRLPELPRRLWAYAEHRCRAHTKSEARAEFKKILGVARLPAGAYIAEVK